MRLAVDARELEGRPTGVGRYLGNLLARWAREPDLAIHLYTREPLGTAPGCLPVVPVKAPSGTAWLAAALPRRLAKDRPDLVFGPGYALPLGPSPGAVVLHDLSFESLPETFSPREALRRQGLARLAASRARLVLCDATHVGREIEETYRPSGAIRVVPLGVDALFSSPADADRIRRLGPVEGPVLAFAGSLFNRRHPEAIVAAAADVFRRTGGGTLLLAGDDRTRPRIDLAAAAAAAGIADRVRLLSFLDDVDLRAALAVTDVFLWPSDYEGFGLPPLEAMAAGVPVVATRIPVLLETLADAAVLVSRPDARSLADGVLSLLEDPARRAALVARGRVRAASFTWDACAAETLRLLRGAAEAP